MSRQKAPSKGDRHGKNHGRPIFAAMRGPRTLPPPNLRVGQVRCPVCRNGVTPVGSGRLRQHRDVFGETCYNTAPVGEVIVAVDLPPMDPRLLLSETNTLPPNGACQECAKPIPPMRRLCGRCMSRRRP